MTQPQQQQSNPARQPRNESLDAAMLAFLATQQEAFVEAMETKIDRREEECVKRKLAKKNKLFDPIKNELRLARNLDVRVVQQYLCDNCDEIIQTPEEGFVVYGNISLANPEKLCGVIGNNFPPPDENGLIKFEDIKKTVLCKECFVKGLNLLKVKPSTRKR